MLDELAEGDPRHHRVAALVDEVARGVGGERTVGCRAVRPSGNNTWKKPSPRMAPGRRRTIRGSFWVMIARRRHHAHARADLNAVRRQICAGFLTSSFMARFKGQQVPVPRRCCCSRWSACWRCCLMMTVTLVPCASCRWRRDGESLHVRASSTSAVIEPRRSMAGVQFELLAHHRDQRRS